MKRADSEHITVPFRRRSQLKQGVAVGGGHTYRTVLLSCRGYWIIQGDYTHIWGSSCSGFNEAEQSDATCDDLFTLSSRFRLDLKRV